ncbi:MAG: FecR domain-containing protein [Leptospirales bacterium]|nr:FecR domain-containing protein [Leptospirales bacterium]
MKKTLSFAAIVAVLFMFTAAAMADVTVVSVKGTAAYSMGDKWVPLEVGVKIKEGSKVSTGIKSIVVLKLANSTVTVEPLSMMKIYEDKITKDSSDTRLALRRGSLKAEVNKMHEVKTTFKVATPVATSSVRGTIQHVTTSPYGTFFSAPQGSITVESKKDGSRVISGDLRYNQKTSKNNPEDIMKDRGVIIADVNLTDEERKGHKLMGDRSPDGASGVGDFISNMINDVGSVEIKPNWMDLDGD